MPGRVRSKSEAKRSAIQAAASELFLELGFEATSMDKVAQQAEVSKQTVYSHFSNKEALFAAVIEYKCEEYGLRADIFDAGKSCAENLLTYATHMCEMLCTESAVKMERLCSSNAAERPDLALLFFESGPRKVIGILEDYIATQVEQGVLAIDDVERAASLFLHAAQANAVSLARWGVSDQNRQNTAEYLQDAVDMFMQYYGT
jgi:TetR/AcrR family transcriptional regulator, mexJK operon transcriptional repressor